MAHHEKKYVVKGARNRLGTIVFIEVIHPDADEASHALFAAFDEIDRIEGLMSVRKATSEVGIMNNNGFCENVSNDTTYVIEKAHRYSDLSDGAFDITVLPILRLWEDNVRGGRVPAKAEIAERLDLVDYRNVVLAGKKVGFRKAGMGITLAGVAKGYAADRAGTMLRQCNIEHGLVNAGGDIVAVGGKTDTLPWKIGIRNPKNRSRLAATVDLRDQAVATSGNYSRPFNDIFDPRKGTPAQGVASSTVVADHAIDADALASSVFVLGSKKGRELTEGLERVKCFVVGSDGYVLQWPRVEQT